MDGGTNGVSGGGGGVTVEPIITSIDYTTATHVSGLDLYTSISGSVCRTYGPEASDRVTYTIADTKKIINNGYGIVMSTLLSLSPRAYTTYSGTTYVLTYNGDKSVNYALNEILSELVAVNPKVNYLECKITVTMDDNMCWNSDATVMYHKSTGKWSIETDARWNVKAPNSTSSFSHDYRLEALIITSYTLE